MDKEIIKVISSLAQGKVVFFATETVYAMAADVRNKKAVQKIYEMKGRDENKPLAVMVNGVEKLHNIAKIDSRARRLFEAFCPGALTIILPKCENSQLPEYLNQGFDNVAVRIPQNKLAQEILNNYDGLIVATSANPSEQDAAINKEQVVEYFGSDIIIAADDFGAQGVASTIVDMSNGDIEVLREGLITKQQILDFI